MEGRGESADLLSLYEMCANPIAPAWWPEGQLHAWPGAEKRVLAGFSFGAFVQTLVAREVKGRPPELILVGLAASRFPALPVAPGALVIHGERDDVVALMDVLDWARPQRQPVTVIPNAGHFFHGDLMGLKGIVSDYLSARYNSEQVKG